jgi:hypothetical protein
MAFDQCGFTVASTPPAHLAPIHFGRARFSIRRHTHHTHHGAVTHVVEIPADSCGKQVVGSPGLVQARNGGGGIRRSATMPGRGSLGAARGGSAIGGAIGTKAAFTGGVGLMAAVGSGGIAALASSTGSGEGGANAAGLLAGTRDSQFGSGVGSADTTARQGSAPGLSMLASGAGIGTPASETGTAIPMLDRSPIGSVTDVPEPASIVVLAVGALVAIALSRIKTQYSAAYIPKH